MIDQQWSSSFTSRLLDLAGSLNFQAPCNGLQEIENILLLPMRIESRPMQYLVCNLQECTDMRASAPISC